MSERADHRLDLWQSHRTSQTTLDTCTASIGQRPGSENRSADTSAYSRRHPHQPQYGTVGDVPVSSSSSSTAGGLSSAVHPPSSKQQPSDQRAELACSKHSCGLRSRAFSHALLAALLCSLLLSTPLQAARTAPPPPVDSQVCHALAVQLTEDRRHAPALLLCLLHAMRCRQGTGCLIIQHPRMQGARPGAASAPARWQWPSVSRANLTSLREAKLRSTNLTPHHPCIAPKVLSPACA